MKRAIIKTNLGEKFTEHDLRAKVASEIDLEHARMLLGHQSIKTTEDVYRRKALKVSPANLLKS